MSQSSFWPEVRRVKRLSPEEVLALPPAENDLDQLILEKRKGQARLQICESQNTSLGFYAGLFSGLIVSALTKKLPFMLYTVGIGASYDYMKNKDIDCSAQKLQLAEAVQRMRHYHRDPSHVVETVRNAR